MQPGQTSDVQISESSDAVKNILTREHKEVDHNANEKKGEEGTPIHEALKGCSKDEKACITI